MSDQTRGDACQTRNDPASVKDCESLDKPITNATVMRFACILERIFEFEIFLPLRCGSLRICTKDSRYINTVRSYDNSFHPKERECLLIFFNNLLHYILMHQSVSRQQFTKFLFIYCYAFRFYIMRSDIHTINLINLLLFKVKQVQFTVTVSNIVAGKVNLPLSFFQYCYEQKSDDYNNIFAGEQPHMEMTERRFDDLSHCAILPSVSLEK